MRALSVQELLQVWEQGCSQSLVDRALTLLAAACPEMPIQELAELSIGQRDARLLSLREWAFGSQLVSAVNCPSCGDRLELNFNIADIRTTSDTTSPSTLSLEQEGYLVRFRLPNSYDVAIAATQDAAVAQQQLLKRCVLEILHNAEPYSLEQLPKEILDAMVEQMALADPQADIKFALTCPACQHTWKSVFDIVSYFWDELNVWAVRLLREVHVLATVYGWHEADILTMHPYRRQLYLEMVGS